MKTKKEKEYLLREINTHLMKILNFMNIKLLLANLISNFTSI